MKRVMALFVAAVVLTAAVRLYAEDTATAAPKAEHQKPMCCMFMEKFTLFTPEQKAKVTALHEECNQEKCSTEAQAKFFKATKALLTPEQIATCKANCEKNGIVGCPICGGAKPKTAPKTETEG